MQAIGVTLKTFLQALPLLAKPKYFKYVIYSGLVSVAFYCIALILFWYGGDALTDLLTNRIKVDWLRGVLDVLTNVIAFLGLGALLLVLYKHIVLIIVGPIMGKLSETIEKNEGNLGKPQQFGTVYSTYRGVRIASRNIVRELIITGLLLVLTITPLAILTVPLIFIVQAYYAGFGNLDIYLGRHLKFKETVTFVKSNKLLAVANGSLFLLLLLIPFLGAFIAPAFAAATATLSLSREDLI